MNNIRSIVKVMNFHSLLRVDKSRSKAKKYMSMESTLMEMIEAILYNRNIMLDMKQLRVDPKKPKLYIYIGSDMGFCANINSLVKKEMTSNAVDPETGEPIDDGTLEILIGKKLLAGRKRPPLLYTSREDFDKNPRIVMDLIDEGVKQMKYSAIFVVYNRFENTSSVAFASQQIFPLPEKNDKVYTEDFTIEGEPEELLKELIALYAKYTFEIAAAGSFAAENINRQSVTTESLRKIDEREEVKVQEKRRSDRDKQFAKVLDNFTHRM